MGRPTLPFHFPSSGKKKIRKIPHSFSALLSVCGIFRLMLLRRQEKGVTRATEWFCWQCWAWEKVKLYLMGSGWSRKQGFGSLLRGGLTFCSGSEMPQPEPSIWWGSSQALLLTQPLAGAHYSTDVYIQFRCKNTWEMVDRKTEWEGEWTENPRDWDRQRAINHFTSSSQFCLQGH